MQKVMAYVYSDERKNGERKNQQEVEILDQKTEDGVTTYTVKTQSGIICKAIYNIFSGSYYADDVYEIVEAPSEKQEMQM